MISLGLRGSSLLGSASLAVLIAATAHGAAFAGEIVGQVTDAATHKGVAGAQVEIAGRRASAKAASDGSFSFPGLPAGRYQLTTSNPGYADAQAEIEVPADGQVRVQLEAPATGAQVSEVTITGKYRERSAQTLQLQSDNAVAVLTAKDLTYTPDENIAASLSRLPGVTALPGGFANTNGVGVDLAGRGEANYTSLRGMDAEFNINTINGVDVAQGEPYSREVQLALLPPTGLQTVVVNKTLNPAMDGDAIGGLIDYRTPSAFDFAGREAFSIEAAAEANSKAIDYGVNPLGGSIALSGAHKFGDHDQLGIYVSAYYDVRDFSNSIVDGIYPAQTNGMWAYTLQQANGSSAPVNDLSHNLTLTGLDLGYTTGVEERWGGSMSIDWRPSSDLSAYMRMTYAHQSVIQDSYYAQIYGNNIGSQEIGTSGVYQPLIGNVQPRFYYETNPEEALLATYQIGSDMRFGRLHLSPNLFASWGDNDEPDHFEFSARQPEVAAGYAYGGSALFGYGGSVPRPLLPADELANIFDIASYGARRAGEVTDEFASQVKLGAKIDGSVDVNTGWLQSIQFGAKFQNSSRDHNVRDYTSDKLYSTDANDPSFGSLGVFSGSVKAIVPGLYNYSIPTISNSKAFALFYKNIASDFGGNIANASDQCGSSIQDTINCDTQHGIEQVSSTYVMFNLKVGDLEIVPGLRFEHTDISNTYYVIPADDSSTVSGYFQTNHTSYNKVLPSISANYRPNPMSVYRAAVWTSYVRPSMFQLGGGEQISTSSGGAGAGGTTTITEGNPNLKTIDAVNYDVSGQWMNSHGGSASVAFFYKSLDHFIFDTVNGFTNETSEGEGATTISKPLNGGTGHVYGAELAGRQRFENLIEPFNGLGLAGNITLEHSGVHTEIAGLDPTERLLNQPDLSANAQLFYEAHNFDVQLSYRYVGPYVAQYGTAITTSSQLDDWVQENQRVDLHIGYLTPWRVHVDASIGNLLDSNSFYETVGRHSDAIPSIVYSGRTYHLSAKYAF